MGAAANFLNAVGGTDICAKASKAYLAAVTAGKSAAQATNAAKQAYISAYNAGTRNAPGTACAAAEVNFKSNFGSDKNVVLEAAKAYINAAESTTCGEAGKAYVGAISSGQGPERAALLAAKAFIANANLGSADSAACTAGAKGFLGSTSGSNNVLTAMEAFINSGSPASTPYAPPPPRPTSTPRLRTAPTRTPSPAPPPPTSPPSAPTLAPVKDVSMLPVSSSETRDRHRSFQAC